MVFNFFLAILFVCSLQRCDACVKCYLLRPTMTIAVRANYDVHFVTRFFFICRCQQTHSMYRVAPRHLFFHFISRVFSPFIGWTRWS